MNVYWYYQYLWVSLVVFCVTFKKAALGLYDDVSN